MIANRVLLVLVGLTGWVVLPLQLLTTFLLGVAVNVSFGLLLIPISVAWLVLFTPLAIASWICARVPPLREVLGILLIPWALLATIFVALMPSMGELESRAAKMMLCESWPFSWECWRFVSRKLNQTGRSADAFAIVLGRLTSVDPLMRRVAQRIDAGEALDAAA